MNLVMYFNVLIQIRRTDTLSSLYPGVRFLSHCLSMSLLSGQDLWLNSHKFRDRESATCEAEWQPMMYQSSTRKVQAIALLITFISL